jgi:hypothetical protein
VTPFPAWTSRAINPPQFSVKTVIGGFAQRTCRMTSGTLASSNPEMKVAKAERHFRSPGPG